MVEIVDFPPGYEFEKQLQHNLQYLNMEMLLSLQKQREIENKNKMNSIIKENNFIQQSLESTDISLFSTVRQ